MPWTTATNNRLLSWGFNSLTGSGTYLYNFPIGFDASFPLDSNAIHSQPVKMSFTMTVRPALYAMTNPAISGGPLLSNPVKNMIYVHSPYYTGYVAPGGVADYYDSGIGRWLRKDLQIDFAFTMLNASPYKNYLIGFTSDDADEMNGFGAGPEFATVPSGKNNYNLAMQVAAMSPVETANSSLGFVYADTLIHSKKALRDFLASQYGTVTALNVAWGSNYTAFDSSGTQITGELIGTGDGVTLTFNHRLAHPVASKFSLQVCVSGAPVAGDIGGDNIWGSAVTGRINERTGLLMLVFQAGHAPSAHAPITVNYIQDGWGIGTGFMDEDDRPSHQSWMGNDWTAMKTANPQVKTDMNNFLQQLAEQYFSSTRDQLKKAYPHVLYLGPDSLSTWNAPSAGPVLRAAGKYLDAFLTSGSIVFTQAEMDFIEQNFGDKPYFGSFYSSANPDSALAGYKNNDPPFGFNTQAARGQAYYDMMVAQLQSSHTTTGNFPYIGVYWWEYIDNWGEKLNWGLVTHLDDAYDGRESSSLERPCSPPLVRYRCGREVDNYGDLISYVTRANHLWFAIAEGHFARIASRGDGGLMPRWHGDQTEAADKEMHLRFYGAAVR